MTRFPPLHRLSTTSQDQGRAAHHLTDGSLDTTAATENTTWTNWAAVRMQAGTQVSRVRVYSPQDEPLEALGNIEVWHWGSNE